MRSEIGMREALEAVNLLNGYRLTGYRTTGDWTFRSQDVSFLGTKHNFWTFRSLDVSFRGRFVPWTFRSLDVSFHGRFVPLSCTVVKNFFTIDARRNTAYIIIPLNCSLLLKYTAEVINIQLRARRARNLQTKPCNVGS